MVLTRSKTRSTEAHLPEELVVCILSRMAEGQTSAYNVASDLRSCALVCSTWRKAVADEAVWKALTLRVAPTAPTREDNDVTAMGPYICSPFTNPIDNTPLLGFTGSFRDYFRRRTLVGLSARDAYRTHGKCYLIEFQWSGLPRLTCSTFAASPPAQPPFRYEELSFMIEIFELASGRARREDWHRGIYSDYGEDGTPPKDYISTAALEQFAAEPHFAQREEKEHLVWSTTVRASADSTSVRALIPLDAGANIIRKFTLPVDTGMDDYHSFWTKSWRVVVTATRPDGKMCQIIDVQGHRKELEGVVARYGHGNGFKEIGGDGLAGQVEFMVAEAKGGEKALSSSVFFLPNGYGPPLADNTTGTDDALDDFKDTAYESTGFLHEVGFRWLGGPAGYDDDDDADGDTDVQAIQFITKRLNELEWI